AATSEVLSRMSHELRTPLNAILGFAQLLQLPDDHPLSAQQAGNVREIHHAGELLLGLVNEVLDLARIESGRLEISLGPVALCAEIERCAAQIEPAARARGIQPTLQLQAPCTVLADPQRLRQVLLNLLSNAVKYNRECGRIEVECAPAAQQRVRVSVRDSGPGLSVEQQARLFRPFERLESAYEGIEGAGIGLALAKQLVEGMQGRIGVDSVPGEGSCFWFELPLATVAAPDDTSAPAADVTASPPGGKRTVLYVEDSPANLRLVQKILSKRADIELLVANNAEDGLVLAGRVRPALILLDLNLPGMDGFEALQRLRADPATRAIPVIAVSANAMKRDIERGRAAGFQDYLVKPINVRDLFATIDTHLTSSRGTP
ncbi:MAG: ATP-binding protein, partial [Hylemonella sp.]